MKLKKEHLLHPKTEEEAIKLKEEMAECLMRPRQSEWSSTLSSLIPTMFVIAIGTTLLPEVARSVEIARGKNE